MPCGGYCLGGLPSRMTFMQPRSLCCLWSIGMRWENNPKHMPLFVLIIKSYRALCFSALPGDTAQQRSPNMNGMVTRRFLYSKLSNLHKIFKLISLEIIIMEAVARVWVSKNTHLCYVYQSLNGSKYLQVQNSIGTVTHQESSYGMGKRKRKFTKPGTPQDSINTVEIAHPLSSTQYLLLQVPKRKYSIK